MPIRNTKLVEAMTKFTRQDYEKLAAAQKPGPGVFLEVAKKYAGVEADALPRDFPYAGLRFSTKAPLAFAYGFAQVFEDLPLRIESGGWVYIYLPPMSLVEVVEGKGEADRKMYAAKRASGDDDFVRPDAERSRKTLRGAVDRSLPYKAVDADATLEFQRVAGMDGLVLYVRQCLAAGGSVVGASDMARALSRFRSEHPGKVVCGIRFADGVVVGCNLLAGLGAERCVGDGLFVHTEGKLSVIGPDGSEGGLATALLLGQCPKVHTYVASAGEAPSYLLDGNRHVVKEVLAPCVVCVGRCHARNALALRIVEGAQGVQRIEADAYATRDVCDGVDDQQFASSCGRDVGVPYASVGARMSVGFPDLAGDFSMVEEIGERAFANTILSDARMRVCTRVKMGAWALCNCDLVDLLHPDMDSYVEGQNWPDFGIGALSHNTRLHRLTLGWGVSEISDYLLAYSGDKEHPIESDISLSRDQEIPRKPFYCESNSVNIHGRDCYHKMHARGLQISSNAHPLNHSLGRISNFKSLIFPSQITESIVVGFAGLANNESFSSLMHQKKVWTKDEGEYEVLARQVRTELGVH